MLTLYGENHWDSPFVFTVYVALREKGIEFAERELDLGAKDQQQGDFPSQSLTSRVPMIDHEGFFLSESSAIVEYLEEVFRPPTFPALMPEDPRERARVRQVLAWLRSDLHALREARPSSSMVFERVTTPLGDAAAAAARKLTAVAGWLIAPGTTTIAPSFSLADADLAFMLHRLILNGDPVPPRVADYAAAIWERPSIQGFMKHRRLPM